MKIIEMLRLTAEGFSQRQIAQSVNCAKSTVQTIQQKCRGMNIDYEKARSLSDEELARKLYPEGSGGRAVKGDPDWEAIQKSLETIKHANLMYQWEEYRTQNPEGLCYSQFCARYRAWRRKSGAEVVMALEKEPGKEFFVDWKKPCALAHIKSFLYSPAR